MALVSVRLPSSSCTCAASIRFPVVRPPEAQTVTHSGGRRFRFHRSCPTICKRNRSTKIFQRRKDRPIRFRPARPSCSGRRDAVRSIPHSRKLPKCLDSKAISSWNSWRNCLKKKSPKKSDRRNSAGIDRFRQCFLPKIFSSFWVRGLIHFRKKMGKIVFIYLVIGFVSLRMSHPHLL